MKPRILVVEDEPAIADTIVYALATDGFEPDWCGTGADALKSVRQRGPALAILDIGLPDTSGFDLFRQLREQRAVACHRLENLPGAAQLVGPRGARGEGPGTKERACGGSAVFGHPHSLRGF